MAATIGGNAEIKTEQGWGPQLDAFRFENRVQQMSTALQQAASLCGLLDERHVKYTLLIVRVDALMVCVAIPGERWEIEFFDDAPTLLERFVTQEVDEPDDIARLLLAYFDE